MEKLQARASETETEGAALPMNMVDTIDFLGLLGPSDIEGANKVKVGNGGDGGYVMLEGIFSSPKVFSFGIGADVSFDLELAAQGHQIFQFDHTVDRTPVAHDAFHFIKQGLGEDDVEHQTRSLRHFIEKYACEESGMILKIDIEGCEWAALAASNSRDLERFDQIVVEFHWIQRIKTDDRFFNTAREALKLLKARFAVFHVHANNYEPICNVLGLYVPSVLEVSYVRRDLVHTRPSRTLYPCPIDAPNNPHRPDHLLSFFPFLPACDADTLLEQMRFAAADITTRQANAKCIYRV